MIAFQRLDAVACRDALSRETLPIRDRRVNLTVPAGVLRIVDVRHR